MRIHTNGTLGLTSSVIAIGAFDGVHQGHQAVIRRLIERSKSLGVPSVVYTFDPPPRFYFQGARVLTSLQEKTDRLAKLGLDHAVIARFDESYTRRRAIDFLEELKGLGPQEILVGNDFRFGRSRGGDVNLLARFFPVCLVEPVYCGDGKMISSTRIRQLLSQGDTEQSVALLGW
ncbi:FAD synthetase [Brevibacillus sp. NRS-1366]|uniref:FAD synthetase n=1 Tax=Brevibacillus sp. NRS-1366 TaxID=3233899 RepID=UPI003D25FE5F